MDLLDLDQLDLLDAGQWAVVINDHTDKDIRVETKLNFQSMLALLVVPIGIAINREKRVTLKAIRKNKIRMVLEFFPTAQAQDWTPAQEQEEPK